MEKNVAIIGGGIFGTTIAITLAKAGYRVDLFEKEADIMQAASGINQFRLHRGYHYPRSTKTAVSSRDSEGLFVKEYGKAVETKFNHYYCISKHDSKISAKDFTNFCKINHLKHKVVKSSLIKSSEVDLMVKVDESIINYQKLKKIVSDRLKKFKVNVLLNTTFCNDQDKYSSVVNCTYAGLNTIHKPKSGSLEELQFEVCEKMLIKLPKVFSDKSIVVLDGPFFCIDPYGNTGLHLMGHVVHAIHASNNGYHPIIPTEIKPYLNRGVISNPPVTNFSKFINSAKKFIPMISKAQHVGSMYTVRTVLPYKDKTDERPTTVTLKDKKLIQVFSGKIGNCVEASNEVLRLLDEVV